MIQWPVILRDRFNKAHDVYTCQELIETLVRCPWLYPESHDRSKLLRDACLKVNRNRNRKLRAAGETVCDECEAWVMDQFMECACVCLNPPRESKWVICDGVKVKLKADVQIAFEDREMHAGATW